MKICAGTAVYFAGSLFRIESARDSEMIVNRTGVHRHMRPRREQLVKFLRRKSTG